MADFNTFTAVSVSSAGFEKILKLTEGPYGAPLFKKRKFKNIPFFSTSGIYLEYNNDSATSKIICSFWFLRKAGLTADFDDEYDDYKLFIVNEKADQFDKLIEPDITGTYAWNYMMKILEKQYTREEIYHQLHQFEAEYDINKIQKHEINFDFGISEYDNCYKYDINSAYGAALKKIFSRSADDIDKLYNRRLINSAEKKKIKKFLNYFVGYLCIKGFRKTFNWIVQDIRKQIDEAIEYTGGELIYANTDGYIITDPKKLLNTSNKIGEWKKEHEGTIWTILTENYWAFQYIKDGKLETTGNILYTVRDQLDLPAGKYITYNLQLNENNRREAINIQLKGDYLNG